MKVTKELIRDIWIKIEDTVRRNKKAALIAVGSIALIVAGLFFYGSTTKRHGEDGTRSSTQRTSRDTRKQPLFICRKKRRRHRVSKSWLRRWNLFRPPSRQRPRSS